MSEAPKRVWVAKQRSTGLSVIDEYPAKCPDAFDEFVSAAALRELCEELRAMGGDVSDIDSAFYTAMARAYDECAGKIERLLEGK